jgi:hypothetical protein
VRPLVWLAERLRRRPAMGVARVDWTPGRHRPEAVAARLARERSLAGETPVYSEVRSS